MTVKELIEDLQKFDPSMVVHCSVDCDPDDMAGDAEPRRVFGEDCMGVNPYCDQAMLLFGLEGANFRGDVEL